MSLLPEFSLTVERFDGTYINGKWTESLTGTFTINTSWQPANGKDTETLPEGKRSKQVFKCYPAVKLFVSDPVNNHVADVITGPDGEKYEVILCAPYQNTLINHYKVLCARIKEGV